VITMQLLGGPMVMLAGDEYGEGQQLRFKTRGGVPTIWQLRQGLLPVANTNLAYWIGRGADLRATHQALREAGRERLTQLAGNGPHPIFAWSHPSSGPPNPPLMLFSNLDRQSWSTGTFDLGGNVRSWLAPQPSRFYQIRDLVGFDPGRYLWSRPLLGQDLLDNGLGIGLQPNQIQALELVQVV